MNTLWTHTVYVVFIGYHILLCRYIIVGVESRLREMSRHLSVSELNREQLSSELETLKLQLEDGQHWQTEKKVILRVFTYMYVHLPMHVQ